MQTVKELLEKVPQIEAKLGIQFHDKNLLALAFIHRSYVNEYRSEVLDHNERLEFLGDSVLGLVIAGHLYRTLPLEAEGHLSHLRAYLVGAESCALCLHQLHVEEFLLLGKGEASNMGRGRERILADLFEAIIGAIYLDLGMDIVQQFLLAHFAERIDAMVSLPLRNWKADLQDYAQKKTQKPPFYRILSEEGPAHERKFVIGVYIEEIEMGKGSGASKKEAEQNAAEDALRELEKKEERDEQG